MYDIIMKKRNGGQLSEEEIGFFVNGITQGTVPDYQAAALLMAIYFRQMTPQETAWLTAAMAQSGDLLDLSPIRGVKVDKHSTGGVGDKTSLVLGPMIAALGIPVAKMSGRGLGHTGGTIDKLESIPGFKTDLSTERFYENVNRIGIAIAGQTGNLAPADKKLYALRDVTATVENISLIASSIMSKKIAAGSDFIVLDVKTGDGAFMKTEEDSLKLAKAMVEIGAHVGRRTAAIVSNMEQPLGNAVGNSLEVTEAIRTLQGRGPQDLLKLCLTLGACMVMGAGRADNAQRARQMLSETVSDGSALRKLKEMVKAQGGDETAVDDIAKLPTASIRKEITAQEEGFVSAIRCEQIGIAAMTLGGGRRTKEDTIDLGVGIMLKKKAGDYVKYGEPIAEFYANDEKRLKEALDCFQGAYRYGNERPALKPIVLYEVNQEGVRKL